MIQSANAENFKQTVQKSLTRLIEADADTLSAQLQHLRARAFPPTAQKQLRKFAPGEAAKLIGISDVYLRTLVNEGVIGEAEKNAAGRRLYSLEQIHSIRSHLSKNKKNYDQHRRTDDRLQVIAVTNFKGGSGKTTTAAHLAQYFALRGYRVLAADLDPQASLSALFGIQPEFDLEPNETLYGAIRYDEAQRPLKSIIKSTYFNGLDIVPGNLELQEFEHETPRALTSSTRSTDKLFFTRVATALKSVDDDYDIVVLDCPPSLGYLTLSALCAATSVLVTIHPQMLDVASMSQFLHMTAGLFDVVERAGGNANYDWFRYVLTRYEPNDGSQSQIAGLLKGLFGDRVLTNSMVKSAAISDAGITKQTLYEVGRENFHRQTYDRAIEALDAVNHEIEELVRDAWGRK
ncbi:plasmid partitioning protein RepA [Ochrobactrum sp. 695/2009]|uniref:Plasmid partitioning protein RepA n=1 Tax=Brucella intermedia TaxID=94625 RepID=A0A7V6PF43_9HYPH|nr:plasmid partitioning protein RepA [Brucella intermedia]PJR92477.1 plasmid partitioning protein RepA [Ochrobactrum sp. 721/2009]PJT15698.1 plasmid partitioning protein RepA [Ochrobactrum sp. 720/2009]PJT23939.1 plasmid partitioning protein RepA [Ochrobactrum sp. 715/2009]PJT24083.1 plasmid partitioning protein RepA [Ochrobactrum sp. 695/2009]PJT33614.1 plasmid partitioning protein RepA [Ochrobactrum sp. 689/2009]